MQLFINIKVMIDLRVNNFQEVQKATNKQLELMKLT